MNPVIDRASSPDAKIALFRSLFRGRDDVYASRFENRKTGKSGYSPACGNEWVRGLCEKPRIKCSACSHQHFLPVTDDTIRWHLSGSDQVGNEFVMGVYPMLLDERCFFLAIDLDRADWQQDAEAIRETCHRLHLPVALERSRSGNGGHIWLFFDEAIPAVLARKLGSLLLTETMERRPDIGLGSYDRFFPNQDTLPKGGFGNLIALPLQKKAREANNSVFLDEELQPHLDQWLFLSTLGKIDRSAVEVITSDAEKRGRITGIRYFVTDEEPTTPWTLPPSRPRREPPLDGPLPKSLKLVLGNQLYVANEALPAGFRNRLIRLAAFQNPEFYKAQSLRLPTFGTPRIIGCAEDHGQYIGLPRGCLDDIRSLMSDLHIGLEIQDERFSGVPLATEFQGELSPEQERAARAILAHDIGVLSATTGFGKTVIAAWLIAQRGVNTLIIVHRRQLMEQWVDRLSTFLDRSPKSIGRIGSGRKKPTGSLDVAIVQSLVHKGVVSDRVGEYGHIIVDECHHRAAPSFEQVIRQAKARYVTGLSATVSRKDGHHPIIFMQCGPVRHRVDAKNMAAAHPFEHTVWVRPTGFRQCGSPSEDARIQFQDLYSQLVADNCRNHQICEDVVQSIAAGRSPLVLTERNEHLDALAANLSSRIPHVVILRGGMKITDIRATTTRLNSIPDNEPRAILATGRYIGEGFDDARLDTLFLGLPVSWHGTIAQYVGRLHRLHHRKKEVRVYDYADLNVPMLSRMFDRRCRGYEAVGYKILVPGSALAGWPEEVVLPIDPQWKTEYAATVRRLIRDGVDAPLATLFEHAARPFEPDAVGVERARSASEAFLYRRLESLPATRGRFRLNAELPIPFDATGQMEVDVYCTDAGIAIELDGLQHLESLDAYRRDRRKDQLLQENGYFVLRFLAGDVSKNLDGVLDAILRTLSLRSSTP